MSAIMKTPMTNNRRAKRKERKSQLRTFRIEIQLLNIRVGIDLQIALFEFIDRHSE